MAASLRSEVCSSRPRPGPLLAGIAGYTRPYCAVDHLPRLVGEVASLARRRGWKTGFHEKKGYYVAYRVWGRGSDTRYIAYTSHPAVLVEQSGNRLLVMVYCIDTRIAEALIEEVERTGSHPRIPVPAPPPLVGQARAALVLLASQPPPVSPAQDQPPPLLSGGEGVVLAGVASGAEHIGPYGWAAVVVAARPLPADTARRLLYYMLGVVDGDYQPQHLRSEHPGNPESLIACLAAPH